MSYPKSRLGKLFIKKADLLRELDAVLNAVEADLVTTSGDGSIVNNAGDVRVGVLATDAQHGNRGGGTTHAVATTTVAGFMSAADKVGLGSAQTTLANIIGETKEPTGFPNRTDTTLAFDDGTHTLTIAPVGVSYNIFYQGVSVVKTTSESYPWPDVEGLHLIYFDASGVLTSTQNPDTISNIFAGAGVAVAAVYWDATNNVTLRRIEERHGTSLAGSTHIYLHRYFGTAYESGGALSGFSIVAGAPSTAAAAQFAVDNTVVADEDIRFSIVTGLSQILTPVAQIPIFYLTGTGIWKKKTADAYPLLYSGTAGYVGANGRLPWNQFSAGTWNLTQVANNDFVLMHYFATTDLVEPIIGVVGQNTYTSLALARTGATTEINTILGLAPLLSTEKRALGTVIYQSANLYTNVPKAKVVVTDTGANYIDWRATTFNSGLIGTGSQAVTSALIAGAYAAAWAIPDWYIDGTLGSDSNSGVLVGAPLQTGAELLRRLGPYAQWGQSVTIHIGANGMIDALVLRGLMQVVGTHLDIIGTTTLLLDAGALTLYQAVDHTVPRATHISCANVADWTTFQWARLRVTSGASADACAWVALSNPDGVGVGVARVSRFATINPTSTSSMHNTANPAVPDTIVIEALPAVPAITLELDGPVSGAAGANYPLRQWSIRDVNCPLLNVSTSSLAIYARSIVFGCQLAQCAYRPVGNTSAVLTSQVSCFYDCILSGGQFNSIYQTCYHFAPLYGRNTNRLDVLTGNVSASSYALLQGVKVRISTCDFGCDNMQIFDVIGATSIAIDLLNTARFISTTGISGSGNAGIAFRVQNSAMVKLTGTVNLQAAIATVRLISAPTTDLTWTQFLVPDDWAQRGITPAMVAGATTVTVPWYDNTIQQVTVSHAVFGGTPGILSVQQISTTQFTITSSSNLDTSTVRWQISPLGRNIFTTAV
jgi:hypothetical protein